MKESGPDTIPLFLRPGDKNTPINGRILVMGILNVTPDSFSDGGKFWAPQKAIAHGLALAEEGSDILDIGAESTRPGSEPVDEVEERKRLQPVLKELGRRLSIPISVDTTKASVARMALDYGATIINDVSALRFDPAMAPTIAEANAGVVLMHMQGIPRTMHHHYSYHNVVIEVKKFLGSQMKIAMTAGIREEKIILDPGIGFGKNTEQNLDLLAHLGFFLDLKKPLLVGVSEKSFIGQITGKPVGERLMGTAAAVTAAVLQGAQIFRVHQVKLMREVINMAQALKRAMKDYGTQGGGYA